jgi:polysaccharide export outer membrane protein
MTRVPIRPGTLLCTVLVACATYGKPLPEVASEINSTLYTGPTLIEPGDVLDVRFPRKSEWTHSFRVRTDGCVMLPMIGDLRVAGLTVPELGRVLAERYGVTLEGLDVTVNLTDPAGVATEPPGGVVVSGEVAKPGMVSISGARLTLLDALGEAGGQLKATALLGNTLMLRRSPLTGLYTAWHIDARTDYWGTAEPIYLQRHDLVFVPNTPIDNANIWVDQYINKMIPMGLTSFAVGIVVGRQ